MIDENKFYTYNYLKKTEPNKIICENCNNYRYCSKQSTSEEDEYLIFCIFPMFLFGIIYYLINLYY